MAKLQYNDDVFVQDNSIYCALKYLQGYFDLDYSFEEVILDNSESENCDLFVDISLSDRLEKLFAEVKECKDKGEEHAEFTDADMKLFHEIYDLLCEVENDHRTFMYAIAV